MAQAMAQAAGPKVECRPLCLNGVDRAIDPKMVAPPDLLEVLMLVLLATVGIIMYQAVTAPRSRGK